MQGLTRRVVLAAVATLVLVAAGRTAPAQPVNPDALAVRRAVEQFLDDLGHRRLDRLPAQLAPKATMVVVRQRDGRWTTSHQTFDEWLAGQNPQPATTTFEEPLSNVTVHVESGQLAFLRADFTVVVNHEVRSHGVDYFTLVKDAGAWKIANVSYTSMQGPP